MSPDLAAAAHFERWKAHCASRARLRWALIIVGLAVAWLSGCGRARKTSANVPAPPKPARMGAIETGVASWYGNPYHGRRTASGEIYDMEQLTAAHRSLPFQTWLDVTNLSNGKHVEVRVTDRGPFVDGRIIDLSLAAAREIDMLRTGTAKVRLKVIDPPKTVALTKTIDPPKPAGQAEAVEERKADAPSDTRGPAAPAGPPEVSTGAPAETLPDPSPPSEQRDSPTPPALAVAGRFVVQAGAFADRSRAEILSQTLSAQLGAVGVTRVLPLAGRSTLWRVLVGRGLSMTDAYALATKVRGISGAALVVADPEVPEGSGKEIP